MSRSTFDVPCSAQLTSISRQSDYVPPAEGDESAPWSAEQSALLFEFSRLLGGLEDRLMQRMEGLEEVCLLGGLTSQCMESMAGLGEVIHTSRRKTPWSENVRSIARCGPGSTMRSHALDPLSRSRTRKGSQSSSDCEANGCSTEGRIRLDSSKGYLPSRDANETHQQHATDSRAPSRYSYSANDMWKLKSARDFAKSKLSKHPQQSESRRTVGAIVSSPAFEVTFTVIIAMNALLMGAEAESSARFLSERRHLFFFIADTVFAGIFFVELLLRVYVLRWSFFRGEHKFWGLLDTLLVASSLVDAFIEAMSYSGLGGRGISDGNQLRSIRILRITRTVRALRTTRLLRFVASLRTLVTSILATLHALVWALLLLVILIYGVAIAFTEAATHYLLHNDGHHAMEVHWGSLPQSMFTLYLSISGGLDWNDAVEPLHEISIGFVALFSVYIFFTTFAVLNVLTGVFCQSAIDTVNRDPDLAAQAAFVQRRCYLINLSRVFDMMDTEGTGQITLLQLESLLSDDRLQAYLQAMGVDAHDAWSVFKLLDLNANNTIDKDEFVAGMLRMRGQASSIDVQILMERQNWIRKRMDSIRKEDPALRMG